MCFYVHSLNYNMCLSPINISQNQKSKDVSKIAFKFYAGIHCGKWTNFLLSRLYLPYLLFIRDFQFCHVGSESNEPLSHYSLCVTSTRWIFQKTLYWLVHNTWSSYGESKQLGCMKCRSDSICVKIRHLKARGHQAGQVTGRIRQSLRKFWTQQWKNAFCKFYLTYSHMYHKCILVKV
jgi:hypothetical protein